MTDETHEARRNFVAALYRLYWALESPNNRGAPAARQKLAVLRRAFPGSRYESAGRGFVSEHGAPDSEVDAWQLVATLFALHSGPPPPRGYGRTFGAAMQRLTAGRHASAERRFTQLISVSPQSLPHHLRQAIQLLRADGIPVDYDRLLDDVVILLGANENRARSVRFAWVDDFYRRPAKATTRS